MSEPLLVTAISDPYDRATWSGTPRSLIDGLSAIGFDISGLAMDDPRSYDRVLYASLGLPIYGRGGRAFRQYYGPSHSRLVRRMSRVRAREPDLKILHTDHMWLPYDGIGSRDFVFRDASWTSYASNQGVSDRLQHNVGKKFQKALDSVCHVFATSQWARDELIAEGAHPERTTVVGTGVGNLITRFDGLKRFDNKKTLCVAKVRLHNKGLDLLVDGFRLAHSIDPELSLDLVVPEGTVEPQAGVRIHNRLSAEDLIALYRDASLFALPARFEPWGLVYLEAQLSQVPVLGTNRCAFPELSNFGETGFITDSLTPNGVADALLKAHANPEQLKAMGKNAVSFASDFTWHRTAARIGSVMSDRSR